MLSGVFDQIGYAPHGYCLLWQPWLIAAHAVSDILICAAYLAISFAIWVFLRKRRDLELKPLAVMFAAFIFLCGLTHVIQAVTLWWPIYETQAYVKIATALVSLYTAFAIYPLIPQALAIPSPRQLQAVNDGLTAEVDAHRATLRELHEARDELEVRVRERTRELEYLKARLEALVCASAQVVWSTDPSGKVTEDSPSWCSFTGQTQQEFKGYGWLDAVHPDDRATAETAWRSAVQNVAMYSVEYRLCHKTVGWRWTLAKGVPLFHEDGKVREWVGLNIDIDELRSSRDHVQLMLKELSHRAKNLLMVIYVMALQASRHHDPVRFIAEFGPRIQGLSRSHDLLVRNEWKGASLADHVSEQLQPFCPAGTQRVRYSGPPIMLTPAATQALGLAFHELATNASKYGALAKSSGFINVSWEISASDKEPLLKLMWSEVAAGRDPAQKARKGFGSTVLMRVVPRSVSGESTFQINDSSVIWELRAPLKAVGEMVSDSAGQTAQNG